MNYEDKRAAYVKLADRLHNMRTISGHSSLAKQKHIANETLSFFVGLAEKLRLTTVAQELERLSLEVLGKK
jgi:(p)ppGpp synthase/HD superfamily hydrolase